MNAIAAHGIGHEAAVEGLREWFRCEPGSLIAAIERQLLARVLPDLFGYHILQLGCHHVDDLISTSRISHHVRVGLSVSGCIDAQMCCREDALPLAPGAIDVLVLPHVLEFARDPRRVLREAERVLIGEGHIVVLGFNPWSLYGAWSLLLRWRDEVPWAARFIGATRVKDWLQLLGFDVMHFERASFRPPSRGTRINRRLAFLEKLGAFCWPGLGNIYMIVGRKRVEAVTPLKTSWQARRRLVAGGVVEPSTRVRASDAGRSAGT